MPRQRGEKNKKLSCGIKNRSAGICKKVQTFNRLYGGEALVIIKPTGGSYIRFESQPGLFQTISSQARSGFRDFESFSDSEGSLQDGLSSPPSLSSRESSLSSLETASYVSDLSSSPEAAQCINQQDSVPEAFLCSEQGLVEETHIKRPEQTSSSPRRRTLTTHQRRQILDILWTI
jgi:hypothetical protein